MCVLQLLSYCRILIPVGVSMCSTGHFSHPFFCLFRWWLLLLCTLWSVWVHDFETLGLFEACSENILLQKGIDLLYWKLPQGYFKLNTQLALWAFGGGVFLYPLYRRVTLGNFLVGSFFFFLCLWQDHIPLLYPSVVCRYGVLGFSNSWTH